MKLPEDGVRDTLGRMADKLVELGYADRVILEDAPKVITVFWTDSGRVLQRDIGNIFDGVRKGEEINALDIQILLALFFKTNSGENPGNRD